MFLTSLCCGREGSYNFCGIPVRFENKDEGSPSCFNQLFSMIFRGYDVTFAHEMGHALIAQQLIPDSNPEITIPIRACCTITHSHFIFRIGPSGFTEYEVCDDIPMWKRSIVSMAGPVTGVAYSFCKLIVAIALQNIFWPATLVLGAMSIYHITTELIDVLRGILNSDHPDFQGIDFADIARDGGYVHLLCALAVLVVEVALGVLLVCAIAL